MLVRIHMMSKLPVKHINILGLKCKDLHKNMTKSQKLVQVTTTMNKEKMFLELGQFFEAKYLNILMLLHHKLLYLHINWHCFSCKKLFNKKWDHKSQNKLNLSLKNQKSRAFLLRKCHVSNLKIKAQQKIQDLVLILYNLMKLN